MEFYTLLLFYSTLSIASGCFKRKELPAITKLSHGPWSFLSSALKEFDCECGTYDNGNAKGGVFIGKPHSILYIYIKERDSSCMGTIVSSNLVATSHACIETGNSIPNVFDAWNVQTRIKSFYTALDLTVSTEPVGEGQIFKVEDVIPSAQYLQLITKSNLKDKSFTVNSRNIRGNIVLLKVQASFTTHPTHKPVCLPPSDLSIMSQTGYYVGAGTEPHPSKFADVHHGLIVSMKKCKNDEYDEKEANDMQNLESLCVQWDKPTYELSKLFAGGPLLYPVRGQDVNTNRLQLVGLLHDLTMNQDDDYIYGYFTNTIPLVKYIKYMGQQSNSTWCKKRDSTYNENRIRPFDDHLICENKAEEGKADKLDIALYEIQLKMRDFNSRVILQGAPMKYYDRSVINHEKDGKHLTLPNPEIHHSIRIGIINHINQILPQLTIKYEEPARPEFAPAFVNINLAGNIKKAYENLIHKKEVPADIILEASIPPKTLWVEPCTLVSVSASYTYAHRVALSYEAYVEVSAQLENGKFLSAALVKDQMPKEFDLIGLKSCHKVKAVGRGEIYVSFPFNDKISENSKATIEC